MNTHMQFISPVMTANLGKMLMASPGEWLLAEKNMLEKVDQISHNILTAGYQFMLNSNKLSKELMLNCINIEMESANREQQWLTLV